METLSRCKDVSPYAGFWIGNAACTFIAICSVQSDFSHFEQRCQLLADNLFLFESNLGRWRYDFDG